MPTQPFTWTCNSQPTPHAPTSSGRASIRAHRQELGGGAHASYTLAVHSPYRPLIADTSSPASARSAHRPTPPGGRHVHATTIALQPDRRNTAANHHQKRGRDGVAPSRPFSPLPPPRNYFFGGEAGLLTPGLVPGVEAGAGVFGGWLGIPGFGLGPLSGFGDIIDSPMRRKVAPGIWIGNAPTRRGSEPLFALQSAGVDATGLRRPPRICQTGERDLHGIAMQRQNAHLVRRLRCFNPLLRRHPNHINNLNHSATRYPARP